MSKNSEDRSPSDDRQMALTALALSGGRLERCPDDDQLLAWQERLLPGEEVTRIEGHVAHCTRCFTLWQDLQAVADDDPHRTSTGRLRHRFAGLSPAAGLAALAASLALVVAVGMLFQGPSPVPLPAYEISLQGRAIVRGAAPEGDAGGVIEVAPGMRYELVLRPESAIEDELELRTWALTAHGELARIAASATFTPRGTVLAEGAVDDQWPLPPGDASLLVVLGRKGSLPAARDVLSELGEDRRVRSRDYYAWRVAIRTLP